ncbi:MAG: glycosyltransferase family 39 protein [Candidatus Aminicenantes bacterium]|nr:glycosyltransferase family 39 protein [Candidatus Aminicenantes bacterium]
MSDSLKNFAARAWRSEYFFAVFFSLLTLLLHAVCLGQYDYFRDEFYYIACSDHLAFGYVDHPPLAMLLLKGVRLLLGDSLAALRLLPMLAAALLVFGAGRLAKEMGGGRFAVTLGSAAAFSVLGNFFLFHIYSMNFLDHLFWLACFLLLIRIIKRNQPRLWVFFGLLAGLGLQNKTSVLFLLFGVAVAVLLLPELRALLRTPWPWLGGALAALIFLPYLIWNAAHGWPMLEFMRNAAAYKITALSPAAFLREQILYNNPVSLLVWAAGLGFFLFSRRGRAFRLFGILYLSIYLLFNVQHAKSYYLAPAYPALFAGGAVLWETWLAKGAGPKLRAPLICLVLVAALVLAPMMLPILPADRFIRYQSWIGLQPQSGENHEMGPLPQTFADMFGWREMTAKVAFIYRDLPDKDKRDCLIFGDNYGIAGAISFFGKKEGLPPVISGHNNYALWLPENPSANVMITVGADPVDLESVFEEVRQLAETGHPYAMPYENRNEICLVRGLKIPFSELKKLIRHFE